MKRLLLVSLLFLSACDTINTNNTPASPTPVPATTKIEFRAQGQQLNPNTPVVIKHTDSINGITVYNGSLPYQADFDLIGDNIFLSIDGTASGLTASSTLQVQIFVNGVLFREGLSQGVILTTAASGTYRK